MKTTKWHYNCCQEDLTEVEVEDVLVEDTDTLFDTKAEAQLSIIAMWMNSIENVGTESVIRNIKETLEK